MPISAPLLAEFDHEMQTTRALLARTPEADAAWRPHPKSTPLGELAIHVAGIVGVARLVAEQPELDFNPPGGTPWQPPRFETTARLLEFFDRNRDASRGAIAGVSDEAMHQPWSLKNAGKIFFTMPRIGAFRTFVMNHVIHHRGQLSVYYRLRDVALPSIYGPTADEPR